MPQFANRALKRFAGMEARPQPPLLRLRDPVMMMHGFGMMASLRRGGHLHEEALYLRTCGVLAYAPNVAPFHTVKTRTAMWKRHVTFILEETGAERISLIAHSMGGLDARTLVHEEGMSDVINAVVTVASPHAGSSIADLVIEQPGLIQTPIRSIADWMGTYALDDATADFKTAIRELTPSHCCETFNPATPDHPDVRYWSFAGAAGKGTDTPINPFLVPLNRLLYQREGLNDGFVSVASARWGTFLGSVPADHTQQVGLPFTPGSDFDSHAFYKDIVRMLADEGF